MPQKKFRSPYPWRLITKFGFDWPGDFGEEDVCRRTPEHWCTLRCCHISPDSANGRRTDRENAKNVYPVEKVVSVAMKVVAEGVRSA